MGASASLFDRYDRSGVLHPTMCWIAPEIPRANVNLWRDRLAARSDLTVNGQPLGIADRARGSKIGSQCIGQLLGYRDVLLRLMPRR